MLVFEFVWHVFCNLNYFHINSITYNWLLIYYLKCLLCLCIFLYFHLISITCCLYFVFLNVWYKSLGSDWILDEKVKRLLLGEVLFIKSNFYWEDAQDIIESGSICLFPGILEEAALFWLINASMWSLVLTVLLGFLVIDSNTYCIFLFEVVLSRALLIWELPKVLLISNTV